MNSFNLTSGGTALQSITHGTDLFEWYLKTYKINKPYEWSKSQDYDRFSEHMSPSKKFKSFTELSTLITQPFPFVVKFDIDTISGLKTVVVNSKRDVAQILNVVKRFNCSQGIVQQFIQGKEYTVTIMVGKHNWATVGTACDYKKQFENNIGLNTSGLGSISPCPWVHHDTTNMIDQIVTKLRHTVDYTGFLSCQFLVDSNNKLWLIENNYRICDPEFQSMIELSNPITAMTQCRDGQVIDQPITASNARAVTISFIHQDRPNLLPLNQNDIGLLHPRFKIWKNNYAPGVFWGSITNRGDNTYSELADEMYQWLATQHVAPYRYRTDIGKEKSLEP
jgi:phosphoribosylamine--glycine ligase